MMSYLIWSSYREAIRSAETTSYNYAEIIKRQLDSTLRRADASLNKFTRRLPAAALNKASVDRYSRELNAELDLELSNFPELTAIRVYDVDGNQLYTTNNNSTTRVNIAARNYFQAARNGAPNRLLISDVVTGLGPRKQPILVLSRAVRSEAGDFRGTVNAVLDLGYFQRLFQSLDLGSGGAFSIYKTDNYSQALRWPQTADKRNISLEPGSTLRTAIERGIKSNTSETRYNRDGLRRIFSFNVLDQYPFVVTAALGVDDVLQGWRARSLAIGLSGFLMLLALIGFSIRLWRAEAKQGQAIISLAESEERYSLAVEGVNEGIWDWQIVTGDDYLSPRCKSLLGFRDDELKSDCPSFFDRIHPDDREQANSALNRHLEASVPYAVEMRLRHKDGSYRWFLTRGEARCDAGRRLRMVGSIKDISDEKSIREQLTAAKQQAEEASKAKSNFIANMSHELRTPLNAILGFSEMLQSEVFSENRVEYSGLIHRSAQHLLGLINDILDLSKIEAGRWMLNETTVDFRRLVTEQVEMMTSKTMAAHIAMMSDIPNELPEIRGDERALKQILLNLISNSVKYTRAYGTITVFAELKENGELAFGVKDTGVGISEADQRQIFDRFGQGRHDALTADRGTGLGLPIVQGLARSHGGRVHLQSQVDVGTCVTVFLPADRVYLPRALRTA